GGEEGVLERVLGLLARAEHVPAEAEDRAVVAVEERLEGGLVAGAHERHETLVAREAEQAGRTADAGADRNGRSMLHAGIMRITTIATRGSDEGWRRDAPPGTAVRPA